MYSCHIPIRIMAATFFLGVKKSYARAYVSDSNSTRDSVVFVVRADKSEEVHRVKSVLIVEEKLIEVPEATRWESRFDIPSERRLYRSIESFVFTRVMYF